MESQILSERVEWESRWVAAFGVETVELVREDEGVGRGLFRLGVEDEDVVTALNYPRSTHEKMELRLSMPREFWPQKWTDEEKAI